MKYKINLVDNIIAGDDSTMIFDASGPSHPRLYNTVQDLVRKSDKIIAQKTPAAMGDWRGI